MDEQSIIRDLRLRFGDSIKLIPCPKPYPDDVTNTRAILLGCDPTNKYSDSLPYVFAIKSGLKIFNSFIKSWERSLEAIGLNFATVYMQNLCRNYFKEETSKNKIWIQAAAYWIPCLKEELKQFDIGLPVLLTSNLLYEVLLHKKETRHKPVEFYNGIADFPIAPEMNKLERPLIPFYRHRYYEINKWPGYRDKIKKYFYDYQ